VVPQKSPAQRECTVTLSGILARDNDFIEGVSLTLGSSFPGWGLFLSDSYGGASQKWRLNAAAHQRQGARLERKYAAPQGMANQE
jgi:hypothetical protein